MITTIQDTSETPAASFTGAGGLGCVSHSVWFFWMREWNQKMLAAAMRRKMNFIRNATEW